MPAASETTTPAPESQKHFVVHPRDCRSILCETISEKLPAWRQRISKLLKNNGDCKVSEVTVEQIYGGIRGVYTHVSDISFVDPANGIRIRGYTIPELLSKLPIDSETGIPILGGLYYLLLVDDLPTLEDARMVEDVWKSRCQVPGYVMDVLRALPSATHPMVMLSTAILAMQKDSLFSQWYAEGTQKGDYWEAFLDDSLTLTARLPTIAAAIYNLKYRGGEVIPPEFKLSWAANFGHMIGKSDDLDFQKLIGLYLILHSDHEGGNVSSHTAHLVSSTLSDVYYSCSAAMNGLAGPLHGLANQECLRWLLELRGQFEAFPTQEQLESYIWEALRAGRVIPGYGHAVLRVTDPRFAALYDFAENAMPDDELFRLVKQLYAVMPGILTRHGKVKNPWPNVDAISGTLLHYYGVSEFDFYTVLFGISRIMGLTASIVWARALNEPIERPKSLTTDMLEEIVCHS